MCANNKQLLLVVCALPWSSTFSQETDNHYIALIQGGTYWMGTDASSVSGLKDRYDVSFPGVFENEVPSREVTISSFRIDRFEVTNSRFLEFLDENPAWRKDQVADGQHNGQYLVHWSDDGYPAGEANYPVVNITWSAAQAFCRWRDGRLPTEAEWEYVARAGDSREFPWGDDLPSPDVANYSASPHGRAINVGTYPPNEFGVYDLAGNVWEFLYDEWNPRYTGDPQSDPIAGGLLARHAEGSVSGRRAVRGASFGGSVVNVRTRWRDSHVATNAIEFVGFRCAYPVPD